MPFYNKLLSQIKYDNFKKFYQEFYNYRVSSVPLDEFIYRGETSSEYQLYPAALRTDKRKVLDVIADPYFDVCEKTYNRNLLETECRALLRFYRLANMRGLVVPGIDTLLCDNDDADQMIAEVNENNGKIPRKYYELFALAQHYGLPTRFLDWTQDIHVALWFAARNAYEKYQKLLMLSLCDGTKDSSLRYNKFCIWVMNYKNIQTLRVRYRPGMDERPASPLEFIVPPYANNPNLQAQRGILTYLPIKIQEMKEADDRYIGRSLEESLRKAISGEPEDEYIRRFEFYWAEAIDVLEFLQLRGYDESSIFPGYDSIFGALVARNEIKNEYALRNVPGKDINIREACVNLK